MEQVPMVALGASLLLFPLAMLKPTAARLPRWLCWLGLLNFSAQLCSLRSDPGLQANAQEACLVQLALMVTCGLAFRGYIYGLKRIQEFVKDQIMWEQWGHVVVPAGESWEKHVQLCISHRTFLYKIGQLAWSGRAYCCLCLAVCLGAAWVGLPSAESMMLWSIVSVWVSWTCLNLAWMRITSKSWLLHQQGCRKAIAQPVEFRWAALALLTLGELSSVGLGHWVAWPFWLLGLVLHLGEKGLKHLRNTYLPKITSRNTRQSTL